MSVGAQAAGLQCAAVLQSVSSHDVLSLHSFRGQLLLRTVHPTLATGHQAIADQGAAGAAITCYSLLLIATTFYYFLLLATSLILKCCNITILTLCQYKGSLSIMLKILQNMTLKSVTWLCHVMLCLEWKILDVMKCGSKDQQWSEQCGLLSWSHSSLPAPSDLVQLTACTT